MARHTRNGDGRSPLNRHGSSSCCWIYRHQGRAALRACGRQSSSTHPPTAGGTPMILATTTALFLIFASPFLFSGLRRRRGVRDLFSPIHVTAALHLITVVPYLLLISFDEQVIHPDIKDHLADTDLGRAVVWYGTVQAIAFIALLAGLASSIPAIITKKAPLFASHITPNRCIMASLVAFLIGAGSYLFFLNSIGGYQELLYNLDKRTTLTASSGYVLSLLTMLLFSVLILIYSIRINNSPLKLALIGLLVL